MYLKMDSVKAATGAYKSMHGGWYKGTCVCVCVCVCVYSMCIILCVCKPKACIIIEAGAQLTTAVLTRLEKI